MVDVRYWKNSCLLSNMKILSLESFCTRPSSDAPLLQWISRQGEGNGDNKEDSLNEVTENILFYRSRVTWCSAKARTLASYPLPWYSQKIRPDNVFLFFFHHALPPFKVRPVSPDFRVEADWLKCAATRKLLCFPADIHSVTRTPHPPPSHHLPATRIAKQRAQSSNLQSEQNGRWVADANLYKKIYMSFK